MTKTAAELCQERKQRVLDAIALKVPDRVPINLPFSLFPASYVGMTYQEAFENPEKLLEANIKVHLEFKPDISTPDLMYPVPLETLGVRFYKWPGHGVGPNASQQFVEGEYMKAEEYDDFLTDPSDFAMRIFLPRIFSALEGLNKLRPLTGLFFSYLNVPSIFNNEAVIESLETLIKAAKQSRKLTTLFRDSGRRLKDLGFPEYSGGAAFAPFDVISDFLRGLKGTTMDMFRCPDKLKAAQKKLLPIILDNAINVPRQPGNTFIFIPLHRGSDEFMSTKQFEEFYWPNLKTLIVALVDAGLTPMILWEGFWDKRLKYLRELPKGKIFGWFDRTDLFKAKEELGDTMCISGGMLLTLLSSGTTEQVKTHTKKLIDIVGRGGGFIMGPCSPLDEAKPELPKVWVDYTREYGVYR